MEIHIGLVRILRESDGATVGAGFVASKSVIITCAHVINKARVNPGESARVRFYNATNSNEAEQITHVDPDCWSPPDENDIAILRLDTPLPIGVEPLLLGSSPKLSGYKFISFGFPAVAQYDGIPAEGDITGRTSDEIGREMLVLDSKNVTQGMSGAPVVNKKTGLVVGMVSSLFTGDRHGRLKETNFATPSETIQSICPELKLNDRAPYLGLRTYTEKDSDLFFGRESFVNTLIDRLRDGAPFIAVVGPSGSGKSSVIYAGLFPKLREGAIAGSRDWQLVSFRPGSDPYQALTGAGIVTSEAINLEEGVTNYLAQYPMGTHLLLFADQFEEVFALCPEPIRTQFLNEWGGVIEKVPELTLMLTLQAGYYYGMALEHPQLGKLIDNGQETILRMNDTEMAKAVSNPAEQLALIFEEGLVTDIAIEASQVKHPLPLVQESLRQLWEEERANGSLPLLTHKTYRESVGGVAGAIQLRATKAYNSLPNDQQNTARHIFTRLVHHGEKDEGNTLQKVLLSNLVTQTQDFDTVRRVTTKLAGERLLTIGEESDPETQTVEIIHNVLIEEWNILNNWIKEQKGFLLWLQRLNERLNDWEEQNFSDDLLLRGPLLAEAIEQQALDEGGLTDKQVGYIEASIAASELEEKRRREEKIIRRASFVIGIFAIAFLLTAILAVSQRSQAVEARATSESNAELAATSQANAQQNERIALTEEVLAQIETTRAVEAEATAISAQAVAVTNEQVAATRALESQQARATAEFNRAEAERQRKIALVNSLAAQVPRQLNSSGSDHELSILLLLEAYKMDLELGGKSEHLVDSSMRQILNHPYFSLKLNEPASRVRSVSSPLNGNFVAAAEEDGGIHIWDLLTQGIPSMVIGESQNYSNVVASSNDGRIIASSDESGTIYLWDTEKMSEFDSPLEGHQNIVTDIDFSPDAKLLASASFDQTVRIWDLQDLSADPIVLPYDTPVRGVKFIPSTNTLATSAVGAVFFWDLTDLSEPRIFEIPEDYFTQVFAIDFSPDGRYVAVSRVDDSSIEIYDILEPDAEPRILQGHNTWITSLAFSSNGLFLASGDTGGQIMVWDLSVLEPKPTPLMGHTDIVYSLVFSQDDKLIVSGSADTSVRIWYLDNPMSDPTVVTKDERILTLAYSPDGKMIAAGGEDQIINIWSNENHGEKLPLVSLNGHSETVESVRFTPDGRQLASVSTDGTVRLWDMEDFSVGPNIITDDYPSMDVALSMNGEFLAAGSATLDGFIRVWNMNKLDDEPSIFHGHGNYVDSIGFSPNGELLVSGSRDNTIRFWNPSNPELIPDTYYLPGQFTYSIAFSPDGKFMATGHLFGVVKLWQLDNLNEAPAILRIKNTGNVQGLAFSPGGEELIAASDSLLTIWSWKNPEKQAIEIEGHSGAITEIAFSPDGKEIASASWDGTVRFWTTLESFYEDACSRIRRNMSLQEWKSFLPEEPYRRTCPNLPIHPSVFEESIEIAKQGDVEAVILYLQELIDRDPTLIIDPEIEASKYMALALLDEGQKKAEQKDIDGAVKLFQDALSWDNSLDIDPEDRARKIAAEKAYAVGVEQANLSNIEESISSFQEVVNLLPELNISPELETARYAIPVIVHEAQWLAKIGRFHEALNLYNKAEAIAPGNQITARQWNLCWEGTIWGFAEEALSFCDKQIEMDPEWKGFYQGRGLARAVMGDINGALEDFKILREWAEIMGDDYQPEIENSTISFWIQELEAGRNPIDESTLEGLR